MHYRSRAGRRTSYSDYFIPFIIIVCIGVIAVLLFNLFRALFAAETVKAAYLHLVSGSVQMKAWGTEGYFDLTSDSLVMQGDEISTSSNAKVIVEFFDGTLMRIDGGTLVVFDSISDEESEPEINLKLKNGSLWFNKVYKDTQDTNLAVELSDTTVHSNMASVFEVENKDDDVVRVFNVFDNDGLLVDILSQSKDKVIENENVGVGQEIVFADAVMQKYFAYKSPTVISAIEDEFKLSSWYLWNFEEDKKPTQFEMLIGENNVGLVKVEPEVVVPAVEPETTEPVPVVESDPVDETVVDAPVSAGLSTPTIVSVAGVTKPDAAGVYKVTSRVTTLTGNVSGADKVVVNGYTLQKYKAGESTWSYFANADFGLMKPGENTYEIYSLDAQGKKSETLVVKVFYEPTVVTPVPEVPAETTTSTEVKEDL